MNTPLPFHAQLFQNDRCVVPSVRVARSLWGKTKGLLGTRQLPDGEALILPGCNMVHMFFMRYAIDVAFCNKQWEVIALQRNLRPWHVSHYVPRARFVIELAVGTIDRMEFRVGSKLELRSPAD